jgi:hypothetical protein
VLLPFVTAVSATACDRTDRGLRELTEAAWAPAATECASMVVCCDGCMDWWTGAAYTASRTDSATDLDNVIELIGTSVTRRREGDRSL